MTTSNITSDFSQISLQSTSTDDEFSSEEDSSFMESPSVTCLKYFSIMNKHRKEKKYCDIDIVIGNTTFSCHRIVLLTASKFFRKLLDTFSDGKRKITVDCESAEIGGCFDIVLEFVYGQRAFINSKNARDLLNAGRFFGIDELELYCVKWLERKLPKQHIIETCMLAYASGKSKLYEKTSKYIARNAVEFSKQNSFYDLPDEIFTDIVKLLDDVNSVSEHDNFILQLINRLKENKIRDEKQQVEIPMASSCNEKIVAGDLNEYFNDVIEGQSLHVRISYLKNSKYFIQGFAFDDSDYKWTHDKNYPQKIVSEKNVVLNGKIYTLSTDNWTEIGKPSQIFQISSSDQESTKLATPPLTSSKCTALATACNIIYYYMGKDTTTDVSSTSIMPNATSSMPKSAQIFAYIPSYTDKWYCVPSPQYKTVNASIACLDNILYLISGEPVASAQFYDHRSPKWITIPAPSHTHINGATSSLNGKLYLLGSSNAFEVFDSRSGRWEDLQSASYQYSCPKMTNYKEKLWAFGHSSDVSLKCAYIPVECYNPVTNEWTSSESLKIRTGCSETEIVDAFVVDEKME